MLKLMPLQTRAMISISRGFAHTAMTASLLWCIRFHGTWKGLGCRLCEFAHESCFCLIKKLLTQPRATFSHFNPLLSHFNMSDSSDHILPNRNSTRSLTLPWVQYWLDLWFSWSAYCLIIWFINGKSNFWVEIARLHWICTANSKGKWGKN